MNIARELKACARGTEHIHLPDDGRGYRQVFVNGREEREVFYADTRKGVVVAAMRPVRVDKHRKRVLKRVIRGRVEVRFLPQ